MITERNDHRIGMITEKEGSQKWNDHRKRNDHRETNDHRKGITIEMELKKNADLFLYKLS